MTSLKRTLDDDNNKEEPSKKIIQLDDYLNSYFFTKSIIDEYTLKIQSQLDNKIIINLDDIFDYYKDLSSSSLELASILINYITSQEICSGIDKTFVTNVLVKVILNPDKNRNFDIAFIIDTTKPQNVISIISFVIAQRSECIKFESAYALNLICSLKCFSCGNILIGLYLYSILCHPKITNTTRVPLIPVKTKDIIYPYYGQSIIHVGLLELGGGYRNTNGLCLYTKFGFTISPDLIGSRSSCFNKQNDINIAMIKRFKTDETNKTPDTIENVVRDINIIDEEKDKIIQIVNKINPGYKKHIICEFKDKQVQNQLGILYYYLDNNDKKYLELMTESKWPKNKIGDDFTPEFAKKINKIKTEIQEITYLINLYESSKKDITLQELGMSTSGGKKNNKRVKKTKRTRKRKYKKNNKKRIRTMRR